MRVGRGALLLLSLAALVPATAAQSSPAPAQCAAPFDQPKTDPVCRECKDKCEHFKQCSKCSGEGCRRFSDATACTCTAGVNGSYVSDSGCVDCILDKCPHCETLDGSAYSWFVQLLLACLALGVLMLKRNREQPRRPVQQWAMDVSKQAVGGVVAHFMGLLNSHIMSQRESATGDACSWYFIAFSLDTSFGVYVAYKGLELVKKLANDHNWETLKETGRYNLPGYKRSTVYLHQMLAWCILIVVARLLVLILEMILATPLCWFSELIAYPLRRHPDAMLLLVMIACPLGMNIAQMWMQDTFLKSKAVMQPMPVQSSLGTSLLSNERKSSSNRISF